MVQVGLSNTDQIWTVFKHCMVEHVDLLMPNRHLDHIILCSLYAICKVRESPLTPPQALCGGETSGDDAWSTH